MISERFLIICWQLFYYILYSHHYKPRLVIFQLFSCLLKNFYAGCDGESTVLLTWLWTKFEHKFSQTCIICTLVIFSFTQLFEVSFHEILNQKDAENFNGLSWKTKKFLFLKKIFSGPRMNRFQYQNNQLCLLTQFEVKVLVNVLFNLPLCQKIMCSNLVCMPTLWDELTFILH